METHKTTSAAIIDAADTLNRMEENFSDRKLIGDWPAPCGLAWSDSKTLMDIFARSQHIYNITANSLVEHAHGFVPHEEIVGAWLDAFGFDPGHNIVVTLDSPADYRSVLDGVYKGILGTWLCKAGQYPIVLEVSAKAAHSIMGGHDMEDMDVNEVRYIQLSRTLPHSLKEAGSVLVKVFEKDKAAPSVTLQYVLWKGHLFDYERSGELVRKWTVE